MFARHPLSQADFQALATIANAVAVGIARARADAGIRRRADELARLAGALQRTNQELDQFAYVASHDLKAPLRGIANLSQWIEEDMGDALTEAARGHLALLRSRVHRMEALIDGILQYSRAGRTQAPAEAVSVRRLVGDVVDLLQPPEAVRIDVPDDLPVMHTERLPLQQVFMNLLGNAIKHAGRVGQARIVVEAKPFDGGCQFTVTDDGPGIAPAFHERIWGIFQTLQPRDKVEGTGIGLALVKKIVESRGGRAWVESAEGAGATFGFTWPERPAGERA
jgi:light-regulated signal transduction histidine kinase (bacteriophytochrome)